MTFIEEGSDSENRITKTGKFSWEIIRKLGSSKEVNGNDKKSYKEAVWQKETQFTRTKARG